MAKPYDPTKPNFNQGDSWLFLLVITLFLAIFIELPITLIALYAIQNHSTRGWFWWFLGEGLLTYAIAQVIVIVLHQRKKREARSNVHEMEPSSSLPPGC